MYLELSLVFLSGAVLLIAVFTVPMFIQIQRLARGLTEMQVVLQRNLPGIIANLEEAALNVKKTTATVNDQVENIAFALGRIQAIAALLAELEGIVRVGLHHPAVNLLRTASAVAKGVRVFLRVYTSGRREIGH